MVRGLSSRWLLEAGSKRSLHGEVEGVEGGPELHRRVEEVALGSSLDSHRVEGSEGRQEHDGEDHKLQVELALEANLDLG